MLLSYISPIVGSFWFCFLLSTGLDVYTVTLASLVAQIKNQPVMQETWVSSLGLEDPLEKGMVTDSSILPWRTAWVEEPGGL